MRSKADDDDESKEYGSSSIGGFLLIVFVIAVVYRCIQDRNDEAALWADYQKTTGWIVSYTDKRSSDLGTGRDITYGYRVGEKEYFREIYTRLDIPECDDGVTGDACAKKRFWVVYAVKHPDKSLIYLQKEVRDLPDQAFQPETLKGNFH